MKSVPGHAQLVLQTEVLTRLFLPLRIYDAEKSQETINDLKRKLREKETKLTDVKLEALSSQHQLDQMKESMNKMKVRVTNV